MNTVEKSQEEKKQMEVFGMPCGCKKMLGLFTPYLLNKYFMITMSAGKVDFVSL